jgi:hypothetical protein
MGAAGKRYGIPLTTLHDHVHGKVEFGKKGGNGTVFSETVERNIACKNKESASMGFGLTRAQLFLKVGRLGRELNLRTPWKLAPGKDWLYGFMQRHPDVTLRQPVPLTTVRARILNKEVTSNYLSALGNTLEEANLKESPYQILNMDEKSINLTHKPSKVLAAKGQRNVPCRIGNNRETVSVLVAVNAAGKDIRPMFVVKRKTD